MYALYCTGSVLQPGTEYIYEYDSHVLTGIPNLKQQYSGIKIQCDVRAQVQTDNSIVLQVWPKYFAALLSKEVSSSC